jgi:hypothetical protein
MVADSHRENDSHKAGPTKQSMWAVDNIFQRIVSSLYQPPHLSNVEAFTQTRLPNISVTHKLRNGREAIYFVPKVRLNQQDCFFLSNVAVVLAVGRVLMKLEGFGFGVGELTDATSV